MKINMFCVLFSFGKYLSKIIVSRFSVVPPWCWYIMCVGWTVNIVKGMQGQCMASSLVYI